MNTADRRADMVARAVRRAADYASAGLGLAPIVILRSWDRGVVSPATVAVIQRFFVEEQVAAAGLAVDWPRRQVTRSGQPVRLPQQKWLLLERLTETPGEVVSPRVLLRLLYGDDDAPNKIDLLRVLVSQLRRLLEPAQIISERGQGYRLVGLEQPGRPGPPALSNEAEAPTIALNAVRPPDRADRPKMPGSKHPIFGRRGQGHSRPTSADEANAIARHLAEKGATVLPAGEAAGAAMPWFPLADASGLKARFVKL